MKRLFDYCCNLMRSAGSILNMTYEDINLLIFDDIEPTLVGLGLFMAGYNYFVNFKAITYILLALMCALILFVVLLFIVSARRLSNDPQLVDEELPSELVPSTVFWETVERLNKIAKATHTSYEFVCVAIYAVIMPLLIAGSMVSVFIR